MISPYSDKNTAKLRENFNNLIFRVTITSLSPIQPLSKCKVHVEKGHVLLIKILYSHNGILLNLHTNTQNNLHRPLPILQ